MQLLESVKSWRDLMWNPHAFIWNSQNYLIKMSKDYSEILDSTFITRLQPFVSDLIFYLPSNLPQESLELIKSSEEDCNHIINIIIIG